MAPRKKEGFDRARYDVLLALMSESGHTLGTWLMSLFSSTRFVFAELKSNHPEAYACVLDYAPRIEQQLRNIEEMLIALSVIAGERALKKDMIDASDFVLDSIRSNIKLGSLRQRGEVDLRRELDFTMPKIEGARGMLMLVVTNLINNALESMIGNEIVDGKKSILPIKTQRGKGRSVEIMVSDTGAGIPPENQSKIFELFFSTKRSSGIGLASAREIIKLHRGAITCQSEVGKGTTFIVSLPI